MLQPRKTKHRKEFAPKVPDIATRGTKVEFGEFGLKAIEKGLVSAKQLEAGRRVLVRFTRKGGRLWIRVFPHRVITRKPSETKMGGGKGDPAGFVSVVEKGRIIFEISGLDEQTSKKALTLAGHKIGDKTKVVGRSE